MALNVPRASLIGLPPDRLSGIALGTSSRLIRLKYLQAVQQNNGDEQRRHRTAGQTQQTRQTLQRQAAATNSRSGQA